MHCNECGEYIDISGKKMVFPNDYPAGLSMCDYCDLRFCDNCYEDHVLNEMEPSRASTEALTF